MKLMKDQAKKVYQIVDWVYFWDEHPNLYLRPLNKQEAKTHARLGHLL